MASISTHVEDDYHHVSVRGPLLASDLGHLERACGRALEHRDVRLTVNLDSSRVSPAACAFLRRLHARGAILTGAGGDSVLNFRDDW